ncbi:MAG: TIGR01620 family protein [Pseudomonadota bacterium]
MSEHEIENETKKDKQVLQGPIEWDPEQVELNSHPSSNVFSADASKSPQVEQSETHNDVTVKVFPSWLVMVLTTFFVGMIFIEAYWFVEELFEKVPLLAYFFCSLLLLGTLGLARIIWREWRALHNIHYRHKLRTRFVAVNSDASFGKATPLVKDLHKSLSLSTNDMMWVNFRQHKKESHNDREILQIYSAHVLKIIDDKANRIISRYASEAAVMVAVSPIALLDVILIVWRNIKMVKAIAKVYGCQNGILGNFAIVKSVIKNILYAGTSEVLADAGVELAGSALTASISAKVAQGLGAGVLTARLGVQTVKICRPVSFEENQQLTVSQFRLELIKHLKTHIAGWAADKTKEKLFR